MPEIILYGVAVSAFVAKVRVVLDLKGLAFEEKEPPGGYGSDAYRAIVPAGSVPGMVVDGAPLHDSNAIVEYLNEIAPEPPLLPDEPMARAKVRALLGYHDSRVEAAVRVMFPLVKGDWRGDRDAVDAAARGVEAALERMEEMIDPGPYLGGERLCLADCAYPATLQMARMLCDEMERPLRPPYKVSKLEAELGRVPAIRRSLTIHAEAMEIWMDEFRK
jgi:glutathione S-transferase